MQLATIRVGTVVVASFMYEILDEAEGMHVRNAVRSAVYDGASTVIVDFNAEMLVTVAGLDKLREASRHLPSHTPLRVSGIGPHARLVLRPLTRTGVVEVYDWWTLAIEEARAA